MGKLNTINFYLTNRPFGEFSNFAAYSIRLKGRNWPTAEHYFQAQKFVDTPDEEEVRQATSPMAAAKMGRDRSRPLRKDWEAVKDDIMRQAVRAKFEQHPELSELLISTGEAKIVEHTSNDSYWGDGGDGSGRNMLGRILMEMRDSLQSDLQSDVHPPENPPASEGAGRYPLQTLIECAGEWDGINRLYVDPKGKPDESDSRILITPLLGKSFVRIDQIWSYQGKPQEGSMLVGFDPDAQQVSLHWIDTFHMSRKVMICTGATGQDQTIDVLGSYSAPAGPDWGWRITVEIRGKGKLEIRMFNIDPDRNQQLAVQAVYHRE